MREHELFQRLCRHAASSHASECREPRIIPSSSEAERQTVAKLALGEEGIDERDSAEVPDVYFAKLERVIHPVILRVTVAVLVCTESVGDALDGVDDGAGEVVGGVDLPLVTIYDY